MEVHNETPQLLKIMFGQGASAISSTSPRLALWTKAFDTWLESILVSRGRRPRSQALQSWELLLQFHRFPPWAIDRARIESWLAYLVKSGQSANTVRCYKGRISGFYRFCSKQPEFISNEPLFASSAKPFNPVRAVLKPDDSNYRRAYILKPSNARALLRAVDRQTSLLGKRDYALLLTLLLTGLSEAALRQLCWKHLAITPDSVKLISASPDIERELPPAAWNAILAYLQSSGRFETIQSEDYIFTPLADPLLRPPSGHPEDWRRDRPLSTEQMLVILKVYATWAGLDASKVTYACLRHSAAALHLEAGADTAMLQSFLSRKYLKETRRYIVHLGRMLGQRKPHFSKITRGPLQANCGPYQRKKSYGQPGNQNALIHGFFAKGFLGQALSKLDSQEIQMIAAAGMENEIAALRILMRRAFSLAGQTQDIRVAIRVLDMFGMTSCRIARLMQDQLKFENDSVENVFDQAIAEVTQEMGLAERLELNIRAAELRRMNPAIIK